MPFKSEKFKVGKSFDRRRKLTDRQRSEIVYLYEQGAISQRKLAKKYKVSRRLIQFVVDPEKLEQNKKRRAERGGWKVYYDRVKQNESTRLYRQYKNELYKMGMLSDPV